MAGEGLTELATNRRHRATTEVRAQTALTQEKDGQEKKEESGGIGLR